MKCETCIKRKTQYCPTSMECMATDDMPYYQNRIMLLEENKQLKDVIDRAIKLFDRCNKTGDFEACDYLMYAILKTASKEVENE